MDYLRPYIMPVFSYLIYYVADTLARLLISGIFFVDKWKLLYYLISIIIPSENISLATSGLRSRGFLLHEENNISHIRI